MAVTVYKGTDGSAPAHPNTTDGTLITLLRKCLIDGYGAKAGAGWKYLGGTDGGLTPADPFIPTATHAAFQNNGLSFAYQIDETTADADLATMRIYDSMTSLTVGTSERASRTMGKTRDANASSGNTGWVVIADEKTCYMFLMGASGLVPHGFGEFYSYKPADQFKTFMAGHNSAVGLPGSATVQYAGLMTPIALSATAETATGNAVHVGSSSSNTTRAYAGVLSPHGSVANLYCINGSNMVANPGGTLDYAVCPALLTCYSPDEKYVRGRLRGLYYPMAYQPKAHLEEFTFGGKSFIAVNVATHTNATYYATGQVWVELGPWEESA